MLDVPSSMRALSMFHVNRTKPSERSGSGGSRKDAMLVITLGTLHPNSWHEHRTFILAPIDHVTGLNTLLPLVLSLACNKTQNRRRGADGISNLHRNTPSLTSSFTAVATTVDHSLL